MQGKEVEGEEEKSKGRMVGGYWGFSFVSAFFVFLDFDGRVP